MINLSFPACAWRPQKGHHCWRPGSSSSHIFPRDWHTLLGQAYGKTVNKTCFSSPQYESCTKRPARWISGVPVTHTLQTRLLPGSPWRRFALTVPWVRPWHGPRAIGVCVTLQLSFIPPPWVSLSLLAKHKRQLWPWTGLKQLSTHALQSFSLFTHRKVCWSSSVTKRSQGEQRESPMYPWWFVLIMAILQLFYVYYSLNNCVFLGVRSHIT